MNDDPIYDFHSLKTFLKKQGYNVKEAEGYHVVENVDVNLNDFRKNLDFTSDGIYIFDPVSNTKQKIFLYKNNYHLEEYGKPRAHIRKCQTLQSFIDRGVFKNEYRRANTNEVKVIDLDRNGEETIVSNLPLCKYCLQMLSEESKEYKSTTSKEFVETLMDDSSYDETTINEVDIFGYVKNWEQISRAYREQHNYTCEECGLQIDNIYDRVYMHTHHINGNKLDNRQSNLRCLCIRCHSQVDDVHRERFSTGLNKVLLKEFNDKY